MTTQSIEEPRATSLAAIILAAHTLLTALGALVSALIHANGLAVLLGVLWLLALVLYAEYRNSY